MNRGIAGEIRGAEESRVLVIGRVQVRWGGYKGLRGVERDGLKVTFVRLLPGREEILDEHSATTDWNGYFRRVITGAGHRFRLSRVDQKDGAWRLEASVDVTVSAGVASSTVASTSNRIQFDLGGGSIWMGTGYASRVVELGSYTFLITSEGKIRTNLRTVTHKVEPSQTGGMSVSGASADLTVLRWAARSVDPDWRDLVQDKISFLETLAEQRTKKARASPAQAPSGPGPEHAASPVSEHPQEAGGN